MPRILALGKQSFSKIRTHNYFYIDKTKFITEWWYGGDDVTLITRPRRFGKTLMLDTVKTFFSLNFSKNQKLFDGLEVWNNQELRSIQGTIPVLSLSFADIKPDKYSDAIALIKECIEIIYDDFSKVLDQSLLSPREKERWTAVKKAMDDTTAQTSLRNLSRLLVQQNYAEPIILLDEYDAPLQEAWVHRYWDKLVTFLRGLFNSTFKTNPYLGRGLITGITRVSKESIFSDLNNLNVVTTTSNQYSDAFGFTEQEVFTAMDEYGCTDKKKLNNDMMALFLAHRRKFTIRGLSLVTLLKKNFLPIGQIQAPTHW